MDEEEEYMNGSEDQKSLVSRVQPEAPKGLLRQTGRTFLIILPLVTIGAFSNSPHDTVTTQLLYQIFGGTSKDYDGYNNSTGNQSSCAITTNKTTEDTIQEQASDYKLYMQIGSSLAACVFVPVWGTLSDQCGRFIIVVAAGIGAIIRVTSLLILSVQPSAPKWTLILGDSLHGCFGKSSSGLIMACATIISDEIPHGKRTFMMIAIDFFFLISETASQLLTGYWIKQSGFTPILIACLTGHVLIVLYGLLMMRLMKKPPADQSYKEAVLCKKIKQYFISPCKTYLTQRSDFTRICLLLMVLLMFFRDMGGYGTKFLLTLYALGPPLCWDSVILGIFNGVNVGLQGTVPMLIGLLLFKRQPSCWLILLGLLGCAVSNIVYGFASTNAMMFVGVVIRSPDILVSAVSKSFLADLTLKTEHGAVMSGYVLVGLVAELLSQSTFNRIYNLTIATCSNCFFFFSAGFYGLAVLSLGFFAVAEKKNNDVLKRVNEMRRQVDIN